jgi:class 3 adenylate cyclase
MQAMMTEFNAERAASAKAPMLLSIGIATGEVVAGYAGTDQRASYTCIGNKVNLAARLEAHTRDAECLVLIDETTRHAVGDTVMTDTLRDVRFKGFSKPLNVYSVLQPVT